MSRGRITAELLPPRLMASVLGCSRSTFYEWDREELIPAAVTIGGQRFWRRAELLAWIDSACPPRWEWQWRPGLLVKLADLHELKLQQAAKLAREVAEMEQRIAAGETRTHVTAR